MDFHPKKYLEFYEMITIQLSRIKIKFREYTLLTKIYIPDIVNIPKSKLGDIDSLLLLTNVEFFVAANQRTSMDDSETR